MVEIKIKTQEALALYNYNTTIPKFGFRKVIRITLNKVVAKNAI